LLSAKKKEGEKGGGQICGRRRLLSNRVLVRLPCGREGGKKEKEKGELRGERGGGNVGGPHGDLSNLSSLIRFFLARHKLEKKKKKKGEEKISDPGKEGKRREKKKRRRGQERDFPHHLAIFYGLIKGKKEGKKKFLGKKKKRGEPRLLYRPAALALSLTPKGPPRKEKEKKKKEKSPSKGKRRKNPRAPRP